MCTSILIYDVAFGYSAMETMCRHTTALLPQQYIYDTDRHLRCERDLNSIVDFEQLLCFE